MTLSPAGVLAPEARTLLRAEGCEAALEQLKKDVRKAPREPRLRTFLFQMFCITGAWDRALTQLAVAAELDPSAVPMAQTYRALIRCEMLRERVFAGTRTPTFMGAPEPWMSLLVEALRVLATGANAEAAGLRDAAFEAAPEVAGTLDGEAFSWIADADARLGPVLEAVVEGKYYWVPFGRIAQLNIDPPEDLRDQVWMPARFTWSSGGETVGFIPTRYPGSATASSDLALAKRTEWTAHGEWELGLGQRMLTTDGPEVAIMDVRCLSITPSA